MPKINDENGSTSVELGMIVECTAKNIINLDGSLRVKGLGYDVKNLDQILPNKSFFYKSKVDIIGKNDKDIKIELSGIEDVFLKLRDLITNKNQKNYHIILFVINEKQ